MKTFKTTAKIISVALLLCLVFVFASCDLLKGSLKLESFTVDTSTITRVYYVGQTVDFSGIKASVKYSDESLNVEYTAEDLTITYPDDITATPGSKTVTVSFNDPHLGIKQTTTFQIIVKEDPNAIKHDRYVVDATDMKKDYEVGDTLNFDGVKIIERFTNGGEDVEMTDLSTLSFEYDPNITANHGVYTIGVKYNGEDAGTITINVTDPTLDIIPITSIEVTGEYKSTYEVGQTVDLTGLTVTVTYSDGVVKVLELEDLQISEVTTDTEGVKSAIVIFTDPVNETPLSTSFDITVLKAKPTVNMWEQTDHINQFNSANKEAGTGAYGDADFIDKFAVGNLTYVIGDDNAFVMLPDFAVMGDTGSIEFLNEFYSVVDIYVDKGEGYVLLDKSSSDNINYSYSLDGETLVNVDTYHGEYLFTKPLGKVKISVLPSAEHYKGTEDLVPVVLEAKVIDAYNVYEAWQLAVIDNDTDRSDWDVFKTEKGIKGVDPSGIVLHNDIDVLIADAPESFFNISTRDVTYINAVTNETKVYPAGTYYFKDNETLYRRVGSKDFTIQGNLFAINLESFPVAASNGVFDASLDLGYGNDFSNSEFLQFECLSNNWEAKPDDVLSVSIDNLALIGNASQDFWQEESDNGLLTAGGLILVKASRHSDVTLNNVRSKSFFISYFPDCAGMMTVNDSKCYDSYQNAAFVWGDSVLTVNDSFINGAGGPIVISMCIYDDDNNEHPVEVIFNNTIAESALTGEEIWFTAVNASSIVSNIKALGQGMHLQAGLGNFVAADGNMNILAVLMPEATSAEAAAAEVWIQGSLDINGSGIERWHSGDNAAQPWASIYASFGQNPALAAAPFLSVEDAEGNIHTIFFDGTTFRDLYNRELGTDASHAALAAAFMQADQIVLSQGGLSVVFEFYHY